MLACLSVNNKPVSQQLRVRLAQFLLEQRSPSGSFNYWTKDGPEHTTLPYPDDLDDTFCALIGLTLHDSSLINEEVLVKTISLLLATEIQVGGPYRTWLVPQAAHKVWQDVDLAVNTNIAYFLSLVSRPLPNLTKFMEDAIKQDSLSSPYYPSEYPLIYYLSRTYRGSLQTKLLQKMRRLQKLKKLSSLENALLLTSLLRQDKMSDLSDLVQELLTQQQSDGSWPASAFCIDPSVKGKKHFHGASVLTASFAIEALTIYQRSISQQETLREPKEQKTDVLEELRRMVTAECRTLPRYLREDTLAFEIKVLESKNGLEIVGLPQAFNDSLRHPLRNKKEFLLHLGLANLHGWTAYTIYDDFIDNEGQPHLLSVANISMRRSLQGFLNVQNLDFQKYVQQTFDYIDNANAWELAQCRFVVNDTKIAIGKLPSYGNLSKLAERSLGHTLTPLAILITGGNSINSSYFRELQNFFKHYLIAKQLNDDAHDWQDDVRKGHITYVVRTLLHDLNVPMGEQSLVRLMPRMQKQFWHYSLTHICKLMRRHVTLSQRALAKLEILKPQNVFVKLLEDIEVSINETESSQAQAINFLKHYKKHTRVVA